MSIQPPHAHGPQLSGQGALRATAQVDPRRRLLRVRGIAIAALVCSVLMVLYGVLRTVIALTHLVPQNAFFGADGLWQLAGLLLWFAIWPVVSALVVLVILLMAMGRRAVVTGGAIAGGAICVIPMLWLGMYTLEYVVLIASAADSTTYGFGSAPTWLLITRVLFHAGATVLWGTAAWGCWTSWSSASDQLDEATDPLSAGAPGPRL
ncbi:hypothetical protein [Helcobacillus massiliensis]|uniref:Uncharacterized protein n=1 Tax=Helcobacillus massiliensis TaxID=521392 RepID=A0A839QWF6_9MICO|nr:hypothetical protein [Helcobacillus massiliensis]MBB3023179.1 hypothetical protein [Helcobacillus massiliensis]